MKMQASLPSMVGDVHPRTSPAERGFACGVFTSANSSLSTERTEWSAPPNWMVPHKASLVVGLKLRRIVSSKCAVSMETSTKTYMTS
eukprot:CAMPEP_0182843752 /NCGR_PEP_ID=MMETSP0006_2-20121128/26363_1 /TAXON_ID=97485 /ORGANISM="Prymnesium parvum, Strain Texoma1" /LENGTH=86 /DNA_ID=CAMNT_0024973581 /DNA_START=252 /DNA_END=508 /DNA_ORIENTATION=+